MADVTEDTVFVERIDGDPNDREPSVEVLRRNSGAERDDIVQVGCHDFIMVGTSTSSVTIAIAH